jgi:hypothetical protein
MGCCLVFSVVFKFIMVWFWLLSSHIWSALSFQPLDMLHKRERKQKGDSINGESRDTGNIGKTTHRTKTNKTQHSTKN